MVTGAGSEEGIGFATARLLVRAGAAVVLTATTDRIRSVVAVSTTAAPARTKSRAVANPIPCSLPAPVTNATCPARLRLFVAIIPLFHFADSRHTPSHPGPGECCFSIGIRSRNAREGASANFSESSRKIASAAGQSCFR